MLKKNIFYNFSYQFLIMFLPFVTAPYLSRVIGAEGIGTYSYSFSIASYFIYFSILGLNNYGNRTIATVKQNKYLLSKNFCEIYFMQIVTSSLCTILYIIYIIFLAENKLVALCQLVLVCSSLFDINWFFFGLEKFKLTVIRNTVIKLLTVLFVFLFVKTESDVSIYIFIMASGTLISQVVLWPFVRKEITFILPKPKNVIQHLKPNFMLFIPVISVSIYKIMDKIMLGQMSGMASVGFFENAEKIINVPVALIMAVGVVMLPKISSFVASGKQEDARKYFNLSMLLVLAFSNAAVFGILLIAEEFVYVFYGANFAPTSVIMKLLVVTIIFLAAGNVLRTQLLIPEKRDSVYIISALLGAVINFSINLFLIPIWNVIGAAIGTIIAELVVCCYQFLAVKRKINLSMYIKWQTLFLLIGLIMYMTISFIPNVTNVYVSLFMKIFLGAIIYSLLAYSLIIKKNLKGIL